MPKYSIAARLSSSILNFKTAYKIIFRLLNHNRIKTDLDEGSITDLRVIYKGTTTKVAAYTKEELAEKLGITTAELHSLKSPNSYGKLTNKISLPLIRLYCATNFVDSKYKDT